MGRLANLSRLLPLPGDMADTKTAAEGHKLEGSLASFFEIGPDSVLLGYQHQVPPDAQQLPC